MLKKKTTKETIEIAQELYDIITKIKEQNANPDWGNWENLHAFLGQVLTNKDLIEENKVIKLNSMFMSFINYPFGPEIKSVFYGRAVLEYFKDKVSDISGAS